MVIITIDGQAGTGKSSVAAGLARALGFELLNTGAMYRCVGLLLLRQGVEFLGEAPEPQDLGQFLEPLRFEMLGSRIILNGEDLTEAIAGEQIGAAASKVATYAVVRKLLQAEQRRLAEGRNIICEGRDQGTAVFPDAPLKFFLTARPDVRADRRYAQMLAQKGKADRDAIRQQIRDRDFQDENRLLDPLRKAEDAHEVDTSDKTLDEVLNYMLEIFHSWRSRAS